MVAVVLSAVAIGYSYGTANAQPVQNPITPIPAQEIAVVHDPEPEPDEIIIDGYITVPGFEKLTAEQGTIHSSGISNPAKNECYIIVSMIMPDGSEIYHSGILAPGQELDSITFPYPLDSGVYEGVITRYSCYALDTMQPLNGADVTFTLEVLP